MESESERMCGRRLQAWRWQARKSNRQVVAPEKDKARQARQADARAGSRKKERQQQRRDGGCESLFFGLRFQCQQSSTPLPICILCTYRRHS